MVEVILQVGHELRAVGVERVIVWEGKVGKLTELLGDVQMQAVVGLVLPQGANAIRFLDDQGRHALLRKACGGCQTGRAASHDDGAVHAPRRHHVEGAIPGLADVLAIAGCGVRRHFEVLFERELKSRNYNGRSEPERRHQILTT